MKNISILFTIIILAFNITINAQTAQFETTIYFEDAVGNKDSVIVGFDTLATEDIDIALGEQEILIPFDSVFEVRAAALDGTYWKKLAKRVFQRAEYHPSDGCYGSIRTAIYVWAKYQPIKVSWDINAFQSPDMCLWASALIDHQEDELAGPIAPDEIKPTFACMADVGSFTFELTAEAFVQTELGNTLRVEIEKEVEGLGVQTIYGLRYNHEEAYGYSPCFLVTDTEEEIENKNASHITIYPNPTSGMLQIDIPDGQQNAGLNIYDMSGRKVKTVKSYIPGREIDVSGLPKGIYGVLINGEGFWYSGRFVRM